MISSDDLIMLFPSPAVDLSDNKMGTEGAKAISAMLLENTTIVVLQLSGNEFDDRAAKYLADAITANSKVEVLDLSYNKFGEKAGKVQSACLSQRIESSAAGVLSAA